MDRGTPTLRPIRRMLPSVLVMVDILTAVRLASICLGLRDDVGVVMRLSEVDRRPDAGPKPRGGWADPRQSQSFSI